MKPLLCSLLLLFSFSLSAQAPVAVPVANEPHHHLVFENSYVRVFRVSVPAHDATLLHQHDLPYVYVSLCPADVINAVAGKPEARLVMTDGQVGYSRGGFAHIARTDAGTSFDNVTIELLHPQGEPRNLCMKVIDAQLGACKSTWSSGSQIDIKSIPVFETDEVELKLKQMGTIRFSLVVHPKVPRLLVALTGTYLDVEVGGMPSSPLRAGQSVWLPANAESRIAGASNFIPGSSYLELSFKVSVKAEKH
jgi:hypothetical protein